MRDTLRTARTADDTTSDARRVSRGTPGFAFLVAPLFDSIYAGATACESRGQRYDNRRGTVAPSGLLSLN